MSFIWDMFRRVTSHEPTVEAIDTFAGSRAANTDAQVRENAMRYIENTAYDTGDPHAINVSATRQVVREMNFNDLHYNGG